MLWEIYFCNSSLDGSVADEGAFDCMLVKMIATIIHVNNINGTHSSLIIGRIIILRMRHLFGFLGKGDRGGIIVSENTYDRNTKTSSN